MADTTDDTEAPENPLTLKEILHNIAATIGREFLHAHIDALDGKATNAPSDGFGKGGK